MKDNKKETIIQAGIKLFAQKGVSATSIQEIATESGISKGAFYLHFKSKDELLLSIFKYYYEDIKNSFNKINQMNLPPREKFIKILIEFIKSLQSHREFITMQTREQALPKTEEVKEFLYQMVMENHLFIYRNLEAIYGEKAKDYLWDLTISFDGLFQSYVKIIFFDESSIDVEELVISLLQRTDYIVEGFLRDKPLPLIEEEKVNEAMSKFKTNFLHTEDKIDAVLKAMRKEVSTHENKDNLLISLEVIEEEFAREVPREPVISGMLSNFQSIPVFDEYVKKIKDLFH
ncbi:TetR/AcrR family transcriptional regulator [Sutcliffiella cohnii]